MLMNCTAIAIISSGATLAPNLPSSRHCSALHHDSPPIALCIKKALQASLPFDFALLSFSGSIFRALLFTSTVRHQSQSPVAHLHLSTLDPDIAIPSKISSPLTNHITCLHKLRHSHDPKTSPISAACDRI
jgi:hypothetical protein